MRNQDIFNELSRVINQVFNKVYCRDIDSLLKKLEDHNVELSANEKQALIYLTRDLRELKSQANQKDRMKFF